MVEDSSQTTDEISKTIALTVNEQWFSFYSPVKHIYR